MRKQPVSKLKHGPPNPAKELIFAIEHNRVEIQHFVVKSLLSKRLTRAKLATQAGVPIRKIATLLSEVGNPDIKTVVKVLHVLGASLRLTNNAFDFNIDQDPPCYCERPRSAKRVSKLGHDPRP